MLSGIEQRWNVAYAFSGFSQRLEAAIQNPDRFQNVFIVQGNGQIAALMALFADGL
jgi:hypothetical protein